MPWGMAIGAAGSLISGLIGKSGADKQSNAVAAAQQAANEERRKALAQTRTDLAPYMATGTNALMMAGNAAGVNGADGNAAALASFQASPGYQYQVDQGTRAVEAAASAQGLAHSGATVRAVQDRATNLANMDFGAYYNRLSGLAGSGQQAATNLGQFGAGTSQGIADTATSAGTAQASIYGQQAQSMGNSVNSFANNALYGMRRNSLYGFDKPQPSGFGNFGGSGEPGFGGGY